MRQHRICKPEPLVIGDKINHVVRLTSPPAMRANPWARKPVCVENFAIFAHEWRTSQERAGAKYGCTGVPNSFPTMVASSATVYVVVPKPTLKTPPATPGAVATAQIADTIPGPILSVWREYLHLRQALRTGVTAVSGELTVLTDQIRMALNHPGDTAFEIDH